MLKKRNLIKLAILLIEEDFYKKASYYNKNHRSKKELINHLAKRQLLLLYLSKDLLRA